MGRYVFDCVLLVTTIRGVVIQTGPTSGIKMLTITNTPDLSNTLDSTINGSKDVSLIVYKRA